MARPALAEGEFTALLYTFYVPVQRSNNKKKLSIPNNELVTNPITDDLPIPLSTGLQIAPLCSRWSFNMFNFTHCMYRYIM